MTFDYKKNHLRKIMEKRRRDQEEIKKLDSEKMIKRINAKRKQTITPNELPF